jgi:thiol peroxidase
MKERTGVITMKGQPLTLSGQQVKAGDAAPDFEAVANDLEPVNFSFFLGKVCIISSVPSLDTSVCSLQTRKFNEQAGRFGPDVAIITISMDLPFAQSRFCDSEGIKNLQILSDYRNASFGLAYGVLIKELRLLARAVFVVDRKGIIKYVQIVDELTREPDYQAALDTVREML